VALRLGSPTEHEFPHLPEKIWTALTQPGLIEQWLMNNDFKWRESTEGATSKRSFKQGTWLQGATASQRSTGACEKMRIAPVPWSFCIYWIPSQQLIIQRRNLLVEQLNNWPH
jgi:hypothetical protein